MEADLVKRAGLPFEVIPAAGVHGVGARALPGNALRLMRGLTKSHRILNRFQPDVLLFTGGYMAVPMALAAHLPRLRSRPRSLLYIPDIEPGLALKVLIRFADHIAASTETSQNYLPKRKAVTITGYPLRPNLQVLSPEIAQHTLGIDAPTRPVLLVWGGSKGARSINRALTANLAALLSEMEIIHISGQLDWAEIEAAQAGLPPDLAEHYHPYPYLHEIAAAFSVADLVISRAGASTLGEYPFYGLPAILVPYPYAWRYQKVNADYLAQRGAAIIIENADLADKLLPAIRELMRDKQRREQMRQTMHSLHRPQAAEAIANILRQLGQGERTKNVRS